MDVMHAHRRVGGRGFSRLGQRHCTPTDCAPQRLSSIRHAPYWHTALLCIFAAACSDAAPDTATVTDSAGVRITTSTANTGIYAVVDSQPALSLGGRNEERAEQFFNIHGVYVDRSNNIWIADRGSNEVRIFRPDGSLWKSLGRTGSGPGEFRQVRLLGSFDDRIAVWDRGNPRLTLLTLQGELDDVVAVTLEGSAPQAFGVFPDGSLLIRKPRVVAASDISPGAVLRDTMALLRFDYVRNRLAELGNILGPLWFWTGSMQVPIPFTTNSSYAVDAAGALHVSDGPSSGSVC